MGLRAPGFRITVEGKDVTEKLKGNLIRLTVVDDAEYSADTVELEFYDGGFEFPVTGRSLTVELGFGSELVEMGKFTIDEVAYDIGRAIYSVRGKSADMTGSLKQKRGRTWRRKDKDDTLTFGEIVQTIADENGLSPRVSDGMASAVVGSVVQSNESDMHFLTRLAKEMFDALVKVYGDVLVVLRRDEGVSVSGQALGVTTLRRQDVSSGRVLLKERDKWASVAVVWRDPKTHLEKRTFYPEKREPQFVMQRRFISLGAANAACEAQYRALQRQMMTLTLTLPGRTDLRAERVISLTGVNATIDGNWLTTRAEHALSQNGYEVTLHCEKSLQDTLRQGR